MKLQTTIPVSPQSNQIDYNSNVLLLGSCFAENMGGKLDYFKFPNLCNPFGIIFNPISIQRLIARAIHDEMFTDADVFSKDSLWHCFEVHSLITAGTKEDFLVLLNDKLCELKQALSSATHIIFTFGTAWVYRHNASRAIVANCHKVPQKEFSKELLSVSELTTGLAQTAAMIEKVNPSATRITSVSPVRHLKDGFVENTRSKAHLISGIHKVEGIHYFPSYELMMDELRDYRFYEPDLLHPNATAIEIIWERFKLVWVASETAALQKEIDTIQKGLLHRPFHPESASHVAFQKKLRLKIKEITAQLPYIEFGNEKETL